MIEGSDLQERSRPRELQEHEYEGHSLPGRWVNSHELRAGDWIITRSGTRAIITEIRQHFEPAFPVSNLTIFGHHNYSVGDVGVLVHNVSVCDGTIADLRKLRADGMSEDKINEWLRSKTDDNGNRLYNDDEIEKALGKVLAKDGIATPGGRALSDHATSESLVPHGFKPPFGVIDEIINQAQWTSRQADGAIVHIHKQPGRGRSHSIVIEGVNGKVVTAMKNLSPRELANLARNYGFALPW